MSLKQIVIAIDQLLNAHRTGSAWEPVIDALFFWQSDHCFQSYLSEKERKQLPREYR